MQRAGQVSPRLRLKETLLVRRRVESWLTKHRSLSGLAVMDFDDRTDTGNTLKPLVALQVKHPTDMPQLAIGHVILKKKTYKYTGLMLDEFSVTT